MFIGLKSGRRSAAIPPAVELTQEALHVIGTFGGEVAEFVGIGLEVEKARRLDGVVRTMLLPAGLQSAGDDELEVAGDEPAIAQAGRGTREIEEVVGRILAGDERARRRASGASA